MQKGFSYAFLAAIFLGFTGLLGKIISQDMPVATVSFLRMFIGFLVLTPIMYINNKRAFSPREKNIKHFALVGFTLAVSIVTFHFAAFYTTIANTTLLSSLDVFFVIPVAYFIIKEKFHKSEIAPLVIAVVGIIILNPLTFNHWIGNALAVASGFSYALFLVMVRYEEKRNMAGDMMWYLFFAAVFLSPAVFLFGIKGFAENMLLIFILGGINTGAAYFLLDKALERIETEIVSITIFTIAPIIAIAAAWVVLKESLTLQTVIGALLLIFAGCLMQMRARAKKAS